MIDKTRNDFEEHLTRNVSGLCTYQTAISQHPNGDYVSKFSQERWIDWQAATLAAAPQWLPIADAPRDGTTIVTAKIVNRDVLFVQLSNWRTVTFPALDNGKHGLEPPFTATGWMKDGADKRTPEPTHWLPLPPTATPQGNL